MTMTYAGPCFYYYMLEMCHSVRRPIATVASLLWLRQVGREKPLICKPAAIRRGGILSGPGSKKEGGGGRR